MAEQLERTYIIPLRDAWREKAQYKRTRAAVQEVKKFIVQHMKIRDRDLDSVKLDVHLNNEMWFRGAKTPPTKIGVKARKEGEVVYVSLAEEPKHLSFAKARHAKRHVKTQTPVKTSGEKKEEVTEEVKKDEPEKEKAVAAANEKMAEQTAKAVKHTTKVKTPKINRMALQK